MNYSWYYLVSGICWKMFLICIRNIFADIRNVPTGVPCDTLLMKWNKDSMRTLSKKYFWNLPYLMIEPCMYNRKEYKVVVLNNTPVFKAAIISTDSNNKSKMGSTKNSQKRKSFYNLRREISRSCLICYNWRPVSSRCISNYYKMVVNEF